MFWVVSISLLPLFQASCDIDCGGETTGTMRTDDEFGSDPLEDILSFTRRPDVHLVPRLPAVCYLATVSGVVVFSREWYWRCACVTLIGY